MMADTIINPLLSTKPSDTGLVVALHPLVLLTASDLLTRQRVRQQQNPTVGILLGQQKGREITAEHAFTAALSKDKETESWVLLEPWLEQRVQQYKDVHKAPALEVVGWFTLCPESGPLPDVIPYQKHIISKYNDNGFLLALHPEAFGTSETTNGRLPLTIYESVINETDHAKDESSMQVDGEESANLQFRSIPFTIETEETEMIAMNYVAKGAGSAAAVTEVESEAKEESAPIGEAKGKQRADVPPEQPGTAIQEEKATTLTTDEEDHIANMTTRLNSVKMLQSRLAVLSNFIQSIPPSYLSDQKIPLTADSPSSAHLPHLRNIQALLTRLSLLTPLESASATQTLVNASQSQSNDVALASMLSLLGQDIQAFAELGRKFAIVESGRNAKNKNKALNINDVSGGGNNSTGGGYGGGEEFEDRVGGFAMRGGMLV